MKNTKSLKIKWTTSRGQNTYGYNICTLYADGDKEASCNGGGYDMEGTVLGEYITKEYADRLKALPANYGSSDINKGFYGLSFYNKAENKRHATYKEGDTVHIDGACGVSSVRAIAEAIGLELEYSRGFSDKKTTAYYLTDTRA